MDNRTVKLLICAGILLSSCALTKVRDIRRFRSSEWQLVSLNIKDSVPLYHHKTKTLYRDSLTNNLVWCYLTINKNQLEQDSIKFKFTNERALLIIYRYKKYHIDYHDTLNYWKSFYRIRSKSGRLIFVSNNFHLYDPNSYKKTINSDTLFPYLNEYYDFPNTVKFEMIFKGDTLLMNSVSEKSNQNFTYQFKFIKHEF